MSRTAVLLFSFRCTFLCILFCFQGASFRVQETKRRDRQRRAQEVLETLEYFQEKLTDPWWLILPDQRWVQCWDIVLFLTLIFTAIITPFEVALLEMQYWDWLFIVNRVVDLIFIVDMIKTFFTAYRDRHTNYLVKDLRKISRNYFFGWFFVDLISIFPYDFMDIAQLKMLRILRVIRLLKLLRIIRVIDIIERYESSMSISSSTFSLVKNMGILIVFGHWLACIWILTAEMQDHNVPTWIDALGASFFEVRDK